MNRKNILALVLSGITAVLIFCLVKTDTFGSAATADNVSEGKMNMRIYPDNKFRELPPVYTEVCEHGGRIERFTYKFNNYPEKSVNGYEKYALVYLPPNYDETDKEKRYDVLYLMHGGSDSPEWFFGGEGENSSLKNVIDHMIEDKECEPLIICAVSYYNEYRRDDTANCKEFHIELTEDIIPVFERKYNTFSYDSSAEELKRTRRHRAFGGFSMGAVTTWSVLEHQLDSIAYYLPISGDCWACGKKQGRHSAEYLQEKIRESGWDAHDFYIYSGCGGYDIAEPNLTPQIEAMRKLSDTFIWCDNFADGNLYQAVYEDGGHDINTVLRIMYNGLPKMFG